MTGLSRYSPYALALLRIIAGLLFMQHGMEKVFEYPSAGHSPGPFELFSLFGIAGVLELGGGVALMLGLFTRPVAFVLSGEMAIAYFMFHLAPGLDTSRGFFPVVNGGDLAILFCFVFLYIFVVGPGAWSIDGLRSASDGSSRGS